ncbi:MAG: ORF6C domain-containing protein [Chloroflexi bacterium]|nr:ORF6C domain-containing protein [Chloroflexota bacterium]MCI0578839.1 ORF6C domain-containing protein [Chloroflexota bacterium]MCI0648418.1 ORF6C domain-containing protein [Chloroflexota bacterium]MCI0727654.1 ORF6C domain-containing protein [Chloroflexota bacterium]
MPEEKELAVIDQREVTFYGDTLVAVKAADGHIYVSFRHLCDALGLDRASQARRLKRHSVLAKGYKGDVKLTSPGGLQPAGVLRVDLIPLWLSGLRAAAVKAELQERLVKYQEEAAKVLWEAFQEGRLTADQDLDQLLQQADNEAVQAYQMLQAMVKLARNQILMEAHLTGRLDEHEQRLETIEAQVNPPTRAVSQSQAMQISQAVKAVAHELGNQTRRNEYQGVYGELYRRFEITSYKLLPAARFQEAMDWLNEWYQTVTGRDMPF